MTIDTISQLRADIARRLDEVARIALHPVDQQTRHDGDSLPIEAFFGTLFMRSAAGSVIEFYTWVDPAYTHGPMYLREEVAMTAVSFHRLAGEDSAHFRKAADFVIYDLTQYHEMLARLERAGFQMMREITSTAADVRAGDVINMTHRVEVAAVTRDDRSVTITYLDAGESRQIRLAECYPVVIIS